MSVSQETIKPSDFVDMLGDDLDPVIETALEVISVNDFVFIASGDTNCDGTADGPALDNLFDVLLEFSEETLMGPVTIQQMLI